VTTTSCMLVGTYFGVFSRVWKICAEEEGYDALVPSSTMLRFEKTSLTFKNHNALMNWSMKAICGVESV